MIWFGNGVFADAGKLRGGANELEQAPNPKTVALFREVWEHRRRLCEAGAEIAVMLPKTKEPQGLPATSRSWKTQGRVLPWRRQRKHGPADTLIWDFLPPVL